MLRGSLLICLLAGCDVVFGLGEPRELPSPRSLDEDGDQLRNDVDPCPHIPTLQADTDGDGLGNDCDLDVEAGGEQPSFATFEDDLEPFTGSGAFTFEDGALLLGSADNAREALVLPGDGGTALIQIVFAIEASGVDPPSPQNPPDFAELGLYTLHRTFVHEMRGDVCFFGHDRADRADPSGANYVQLDSDATGLGQKYFPGELLGRPGRLTIRRTATHVTCAFEGDDNLLVEHFAVQATGDRRGSVAIAAINVRVRIHSAWVVTRP